METKIVTQFNVTYLQYLDNEGRPTQPLPEFASHVDELIRLYHFMCLTRAMDKKAVNLQRTGKMGTYPASLGQEAVGVGVGSAMQKGDVYCPYYRDQATLLIRGVKPEEIFTYWGGDERGSYFENPDCREYLPFCVPIAAQYLHATGIAYAIKHRQQNRAVVTICGEGGTSKGDFYEAMNLSGAWKLPVVFVVNNNHWAISVERNMQTGTQTIAQKAIAAGFEGIQVDGNDVIAVRKTTEDALEKARSKHQPTLIEALTYRLCDHTTADDASRYVPSSQLEQAWKKEPILRLRNYLHAQGYWNKEKEMALQKSCSERIEQAVEHFQNREPQSLEEIFSHLYAQLPLAYYDQRDELLGVEL